jgi:hypothetical protein
MPRVAGGGVRHRLAPLVTVGRGSGIVILPWLMVGRLRIPRGLLLAMSLSNEEPA